MDIKLIKKSGVPKAEVEAHQQIQREFSSTAFSKGWRGYASFAISRGGRGSGDDDFDLVLVTHNVVIVVELKNWNGKLLESNHMNTRDESSTKEPPVRMPQGA